MFSEISVYGNRESTISVLHNTIKSMILHQCVVLVLIITLKMLGLYFYTLIIGNKSCSMLSMLNKLTLQKEWQN